MPDTGAPIGREPDLRPDCSRCDALCCVGLAFYESDMFAFDKPAEEPCRHLQADQRCAIHSNLEGRGFGGCVRFDCHGAGQRLMQEVFPGRSWRDGPAAAREIFDAFRALRTVHEQILLLRAAGNLGLPAEHERERAALLGELTPAVGWTSQSLADFAQGPLPERVKAFLRGLRGFAGQPGAPDSKSLMPAEPR